MREYIKKEIAFERVLFFSDAVVAIAITLLALDLRINTPDNQHLSFHDLIAPWQRYIAFILSFINIAGLWRTHHDFFIHIKKMDEKMIFLNIGWLFLMVVLPFSTSVLSKHFGDIPAVFLYSLNIFLLSVFQNFIWDYADNKDHYMNLEGLSAQERSQTRLMLNLDMINGLVALALTFFAPVAAFFSLFFKLPIFVVGAFIIAKKRKEELRNIKQH